MRSEKARDDQTRMSRSPDTTTPEAPAHVVDAKKADEIETHTQVEPRRDGFAPMNMPDFSEFKIQLEALLREDKVKEAVTLALEHSDKIQW